jgi:2-polyprenyl-3-methyl-5-hydroxy-6-metoxy-1,4-benzoquinol methylase
MTEWKLFEGEPPFFTTPAWYAALPRTRHLEQHDHGPRLQYSALAVAALATQLGATTAVDLGCGDGGLMSLLGGLDVWGYALCPADIAGAAERGVRAELLDVVAHPEQVRWGEIALATEFFEHVADPHAMAREIARHCRGLVCSSPANETGQAHYEFHAWAWDGGGYRALVEQAGFEVRQHAGIGSYQVISAVIS